MTIHSLRNSLVGGAFALLSALLLASCGGGGAASPGPIGGPPQIQPATGTLYAGVEYTITISGGRPPYTLSSSEPSLLAVPERTTSNFVKVIPNNPGVIDTGLPPGSVPSRTVTITMRDSVGSTASTSGLSVAANFFTGYGVSYLSNCPAPQGAAGSTAAAPAACAGGETAVSLVAAINGNRFGNRTYRFDILRGPFFWVFPDGGIAGNSITVTTNHEGRADAIFRVNNIVNTQIAAFRVTDVQTGVSTEELFVIDGTDIGGVLQAIPNEFTFTGAFNDRCGTGSADFLVFDGIPPYTATSAFPSQITVTPTTSTSQPGKFTLTVTNPFVCLTDATVIITDSNNARTTVTINTEPGSEDPPPPPLAVTPTLLTLNCGQSASASIIGGGTPLSASTSSPDLTATISGRTISVTRAGALPPIPDPNPLQTSTVTITDGTTSVVLTVRHPTGCS